MYAWSRLWNVPGNLRKCSIEKGFGARTSRILEKNPFCGSGEFDLTELRVPTIIMCTSLLWRANKPGVGTRAIKDGAKIYFCNRRCCFLTWEGRSCLLYRLSPRKSRIQSHTAEMRSVPERRSGHDEPLSARSSVCDRRRRGNGPRSGAL